MQPHNITPVIAAEHRRDLFADAARARRSLPSRRRSGSASLPMAAAAALRPRVS